MLGFSLDLITSDFVSRVAQAAQDLCRCPSAGVLQVNEEDLTLEIISVYAVFS
jgi:hypothetical protein